MAVTKKPPLAPLEASRSEQDAYARTSHGLRSTNVNMGSATRNRVTPPVTQAPQPPVAPGSPGVGNPQTTDVVLNTPSTSVVRANVLDVGACKVGDQVSFSVLSIQNGQISLGNPLVLPGTPQGATL
jgi:hypothetical protein